MSRTIEVERRFLLTGFETDKLRKLCTVKSKKINHDIYYDTRDYTLMGHDFWLRKRNDKWELKLPSNISIPTISAKQAQGVETEIITPSTGGSPSGNPSTNSSNNVGSSVGETALIEKPQGSNTNNTNSYEEIYDEKAICWRVKQITESSEKHAKSAKNYHPSKSIDGSDNQYEDSDNQLEGSEKNTSSSPPEDCDSFIPAENMVPWCDIVTSREKLEITAANIHRTDYNVADVFNGVHFDIDAICLKPRRNENVEERVAALERYIAANEDGAENYCMLGEVEYNVIVDKDIDDDSLVEKLEDAQKKLENALTIFGFNEKPPAQSKLEIYIRRFQRDIHDKYLRKNSQKKLN